MTCDIFSNSSCPKKADKNHWIDGARVDSQKLPTVYTQFRPLKKVTTASTCSFVSDLRLAIARFL